MIVKVLEYVEVPVNSRIHEIWSRAFSEKAQSSFSICALLKTKSYKRRQDHVQKLFIHASKMTKRWLESEGVYWEHSYCELVGSQNHYDIIKREKQKYKIVKY